MQLAGWGPKFASFAKSGDKIANLATLSILKMRRGMVIYTHYTKCADCLYALHEVCGLSIPDWYRHSSLLRAAYSKIRAPSVTVAFPQR